ncbi:serine/threonine-protein kinase PCRK1 isoform X3 [Elaeis guineensis]|uniref:serine/threonine-protein kinase PCRK1 isoform X3 n=1 Tax=Elaeis guineensis var. tenera TaxID=51953 RepID=UPI003C6CDFE3
MFSLLESKLGVLRSGAMKCFPLSNREKGEPQERRSPSAMSSSTTSTDRDMRMSASEFNSLSVSDMSADSIWRSQFPSFLQRSSNLRTFTFEELRNATRNFSRSLMIGEGGFGCVYRGTIRSSVETNARKDVAIKQLSRRGLQGHKEWLTEVHVLGVVEHPNLVKLIGYCAEDDERGMQRLLVYEFMPNRSVEDHLSARCAKPLPWAMRLRTALDAARGLTYLHEETDFQVMGTIGYAAPEYIQTGRLTAKSDIWSYGVVLYELITGRRPMDRNRPRAEQKLLNWVKPYISDIRKFHMIVDPRLEGNYTLKSATKLAAVANRCLIRYPKSRPRMSEVLEMVQSIIENMETGTPNPPPRGYLEETTSEESTKRGLDLKRRIRDLKVEGRRLVWQGWTPKLVRTH